MKPTIEKIKVVFVSKMSEQVSSDIFGGRKSKMCPIGHVHIFEIEEVEGVETLVGFSFCGKERSLVGEVTKVFKKLPTGLSVCPDCERGWKSDPRSPWKSWVSGLHGGK